MPEPTNNVLFVGAAYAVTWIVLIGYAIRVHTALSRARKDNDAALAAERAL